MYLHSVPQKKENRNFYVLNPHTKERTELIKNDTIGWAFDPLFSPNMKNLILFWNRLDCNPKNKKSKPGLWIIPNTDSLVEDSARCIFEKFRPWPIHWSNDSKFFYVSDYYFLKLYKYQANDGSIKDSIYLPEFTKDINMTSDEKTYIINIGSEPTIDLWYTNKFDPEFKN